ncbi:YaaC family protein [Phycicoccus sp. HDW14]|uniref:YaaC family protein n=1 Tax=Phycicoccus sp. HDW14 TaxID=2714941 RepID=UPI00352FF312
MRLIAARNRLLEQWAHAPHLTTRQESHRRPGALSWFREVEVEGGRRPSRRSRAAPGTRIQRTAFARRSGGREPQRIGPLPTSVEVVDATRHWQRLRWLRSNPPAFAARNRERRQTFSAALEQAEQLARSAANLGPETRPINLFYALSQGTRAIAAARESSEISGSG